MHRGAARRARLGRLLGGGRRRHPRGARRLSWLFGRLLQRLEGPLDELARDQASFLDQLPAKRVELAIAGSAALSLFLELAVIRWQGTVWEFFAFYKNIGLLSCFAGLGLGYALAGRDRIPLVFTAPLLAFQILLLEALRHGTGGAIRSLLVMPFQEQLSMGILAASSLPHFAAVYFFLTVVFLLTALAFVPVGQVCGRLMERLPSLHAYRLNLLGSLGGVALMLGTSFLWTPPVDLVLRAAASASRLSRSSASARSWRRRWPRSARSPC